MLAVALNECLDYLRLAECADKLRVLVWLFLLTDLDAGLNAGFWFSGLALLKEKVLKWAVPKALF